MAIFDGKIVWYIIIRYLDTKFEVKTITTIFLRNNPRMNSIMEGFNGYQNYVENKSTPITHDFRGYHNRNIASVHLIIVPIVFSIIVVLGVLGNILVIHVILSKKKLQTVTNLLLLNLAFSDVCFLLTCGGFSIVNYVLTEWPLGDILCRII